MVTEDFAIEAKGVVKLSERLREVALLFLKLGAFSFGGPAVYIALMHRETVDHHRWIDEQRFLDLVGATNLIPVPMLQKMAIHLGLILSRMAWVNYCRHTICFARDGGHSACCLGVV